MEIPERNKSKLRGPKTYEEEPRRDPSLQINSKEPFNAEPSPFALSQSYITPEDKFYKRNHGPIPVLMEPSTYHLVLTGLVEKPLSLSLEYLRQLPKHVVTATLQCAGNRRTEMSTRRKVKGVGWGAAALGTAAWGGARLSDVLTLAGVPHCTGVTTLGGRHVEFVSCDVCKEEEGGPYKASVPLLHATTPEADILLAYEMNGKDLNRDHGFPLRVVVPGVIGARSVKWLETIIVSEFECQGFFMQKDYKMFPPSIDWHNIDWQSRRPLMDFPVQSAICEPRDGIVVEDGTMVNFRGYALAGGGRGIERVDLSVDGGKTWLEAVRLPREHFPGEDHDPQRPNWAWVLWELKYIKVFPPVDVIVKAVDSASNVQPQSVGEIWNLRGVLNNSWHRIHILAPPPLVSNFVLLCTCSDGLWPRPSFLLQKHLKMAGRLLKRSFKVVVKLILLRGSRLVDLYAKCGSMEDAQRVFNKMPSRNMVTWTPIPSGHGIGTCEMWASTKGTQHILTNAT